MKKRELTNHASPFVSSLFLLPFYIIQFKKGGGYIIFTKGGPFLLTLLSYHAFLNGICTKTDDFFKKS